MQNEFNLIGIWNIGYPKGLQNRYTTIEIDLE